MAVTNIFDNRITGPICHQIADWGKDRENRKKFGKFLDLIAQKKEINKERATQLESYMLENCADLVRQSKDMIGEECMIADHAFLAETEDKKIFDRMITNYHGLNWDSIAVVQTKPEGFMDDVVKRDRQLFQRATNMAEQVIKTTGYKALAPGKKRFFFPFRICPLRMFFFLSFKIMKNAEYI